MFDNLFTMIRLFSVFDFICRFKSFQYMVHILINKNVLQGFRSLLWSFPNKMWNKNIFSFNRKKQFCLNQINFQKYQGFHKWCFRDIRLHFHITPIPSAWCFHIQCHFRLSFIIGVRVRPMAGPLLLPHDLLRNSYHRRYPN